MTFNKIIAIIGTGVVISLAIGSWLIFKNIRPKGKLKKFILLILISITAFFAFAVLHNLVSGILSQIFKTEIEEPVFFILATIVCPTVLIIGTVGSIIQLAKRKIGSKTP